MSLKAKIITKFRMRRTSYVAAAVDQSGKVVNMVAEKITPEMKVNSYVALVNYVTRTVDEDVFIHLRHETKVNILCTCMFRLNRYTEYILWNFL